MPYRRTSSFLAAAATAATAATAAVPRLSAAATASAAVSVVSAAAVLALAAPAAVAAPIPLPHVRAGDGVIGAGHHTPIPTAKPLTVGRPLPVGSPLPVGRPLPSGHHSAAAQPAPADHHVSASHDTPENHPASADHRTPDSHRPPANHLPHAPRPGVIDHLTVTVRGSGSVREDGTFELYCHPARGTHRHAKKACAKLDGMTRWGRDPFAPVPQGANCTMIYGGPATAHVTGTWAGRPVNADFRRTNGCEISRWSSFEPLLPSTSS
ncbi:SSI family serine proteinase inhibitor [Streptomyces sp. NPDC127097]|uniref:SSI family serine proteinase inhibitor n=1 Tax=Streptomyces sp. NPDC127097 TaxID=3347136 RepID=UPI00364D1248